MKKLILITFALCALSFNAYSISEESMEMTTVSDSIPDKMPQYEFPQFPGGRKALSKFLEENLRYPNYALENNIGGMVVVQFIVKKNGSIKNMEVLESPHESFSEEALKAVRVMPKWIPGKCDGEVADVPVILPINFKVYEWKTKSKKTKITNILN